MKYNKILLLDFFGCSINQINNRGFLLNIANLITKSCKITAIKKISHKFTPQGISIIFMIKESHVAIHSWPEYNYLSIVIYTCGNTDPEKCIPLIQKKLDFSDMKKEKILKKLPIGGKNNGKV